MSKPLGRSRPLRLLLLAVFSSLASIPIAVVGSATLATGQDRAGSRDEAMINDTVEGEEDFGDTDVDSDMRTEGGEQVKVFRFSGMDLAGRLKSPQLLYFLNRMRAEFDRPRLPHRSFIPELSRSAQGKAFR